MGSGCLRDLLSLPAHGRIGLSMVQIDITTNIGCKNTCLYCPQDKFINAYNKRSSILQMSLETFESCVERLPSRSELFFAGFSEPWLNRDCTQMVLRAHRSSSPFSIGVSTTLVGMTPCDIDLLEEVPFRRFKVHVPSRNGLEKIGMDENYMNVLTRLRNSRIKATYHYHGSACHPHIKDLVGRDAVRVLMTTRSRSVPEVTDIPLFRKKKGELACGFSRMLRSHELLPNGDLLLCCCDFKMEHILGNLLTQDYADILQSKELGKITSGLKDSSSEVLCRYCVASCNTKHDLAYYRNILQYDVFFLACKIYLGCLKKSPLRGMGIKGFRFPP